jgi:hypothetical protein
MRENDMLEKEEIFSKVLRAGRRTYFFDVRATKADDYYITITESKKFTEEDGSFQSKHIKYIYTKKIFLLSQKFLIYDCLCFKPQRRGSNFRKTSERFQKRI